MQSRKSRNRMALALGLALVLWSPQPSSAQLAGHNLRGDYGLSSGSQGPPGPYLAGTYVRYPVDSIRDLDDAKRRDVAPGLGRNGDARGFDSVVGDRQCDREAVVAAEQL